MDGAQCREHHFHATPFKRQTNIMLNVPDEQTLTLFSVHRPWIRHLECVHHSRVCVCA